MPTTTRLRRLAPLTLSAFVLAPAGAALVVACTDSSNVAPEVGGIDASIDVSSLPGVDAAVDRAAPPREDAGGADAPVVPDDVEAPDAPDAPDPSDAATAPDVDQNCADYATPATPGAVTVRIKNTRATPIYLGVPQAACNAGIGFTLTDATQTALRTWQNASELTCAQLQSACPGPLTCDVLFVTKLGPGAKWDIGWPGTYFASEPMPAACYADAGCEQPTCVHERTIPAGAYTIAATAYTSPLCGDAGVACNDCTLGATGNCTVPGATLVGGTALPASASWSPGTGIVELDVQ